MFTANHFIWLGACFALIAVGVFLAVRFKLSVKGASVIMSCICIASELTKIMSDMEPSEKGGYILDPRSLPFHLCSMMIFAVFYITLSKNQKLKEKVIGFVVPLGLLGGICAMLIPTNGVDFADIDAYQCFVFHAGIVWYALYFLFTKQVNLGKSAYLRNIAVLFSLSVIMIYINGALSDFGTNFMYVRKPPMDGLPILNLDHGWYVYYLTLIVLGFILLSAVHIPYMLISRKKRSQSDS